MGMIEVDGGGAVKGRLGVEREHAWEFGLGIPGVKTYRTEGLRRGKREHDMLLMGTAV